jgi:exosortase/archaeosortase family protein
MLNKAKSQIFNIFLRYFILIIVAIPNLYLFYLIFTPLTIYLSYFILNIPYSVILNGNILDFGYKSIEIVGACVAGSAYYLLLILILSLPNISPVKRIKIILSSFLMLLVVNVLRIILLTSLYVENFSYFNISHKIIWYLGSTLFVVLIWFFNMKIFKIDEIPFYSDIKFLYNQSSFKLNKYKK